MDKSHFSDWKVWLTSISEQWSVISIQGPKSREIVEPLIEDMNINNTTFPHTRVAEGKICGIPTRLFRVSFTGELGFEINIPADYGLSIWEAIWKHREPMGLTPYGTEAMRVMCAEKGHIVVDKDTDSTVTPYDVGLGWVIGEKRKFYWYARVNQIKSKQKKRQQLVGLCGKKPKIVLEEGAQIIADANHAVPVKTLGHITSSYWSQVLKHSIVLALIEDGNTRIGKTLYVPMVDETIAVEVTKTVFYDPEKVRVNG